MPIHINTEKEYSSEELEILKQTFQYVIAFLNNDEERKEQLKQNFKGVNFNEGNRIDKRGCI